jgi:hypothetical protein
MVIGILEPVDGEDGHLELKATAILRAFLPARRSR